MDDQQAVERYQYVLRTAPPDDIERAHAEAFARLTPEQRQVVLHELAAQVPASEVPSTDDPQSLARLATRAEMRQPGTMEQTFSRVPAGPGLGGIFSRRSPAPSSGRRSMARSSLIRASARSLPVRTGREPTRRRTQARKSTMAMPVVTSRAATSGVSEVDRHV